MFSSGDGVHFFSSFKGKLSRKHNFAIIETTCIMKLYLFIIIFIK